MGRFGPGAVSPACGCLRALCVSTGVVVLVSGRVGVFLVRCFVRFWWWACSCVSGSPCSSCVALVCVRVCFLFAVLLLFSSRVVAFPLEGCFIF